MTATVTNALGYNYRVRKMELPAGQRERDLPLQGERMPESQPLPVREQALAIVHALPADASWDELMYRIYVRQAIDAGLEDANAGRVVGVAEVRQQFGLTP